MSVSSFARIASSALALLLLAGRPGLAADDAHKLAVRLDWLTSGYHSPFYLAQAKEWFEKAGLDVTIEPGNGSATTIQLVNAGQYDVGEAALSNVAIARSKGMSVISIAGFFRKGDLALMVPNDSGINGPADLKGKRVIFSAGSFEGPFLEPFLAKGGLDRSQLQLLNIDPNTRLSTYSSGGADGLIGSPVGTGVVINAMRPSHPVLFADFGLNLPGFGLFTTQANLKAKGDALKKFASIVAGAWTYAMAGHEDEAVEAVMKLRAADRPKPEIILTQLKQSQPFLHTAASANLLIGVQTSVDWAAALKVMEDVKAIEPGTKPADIFTNDYLDQGMIKSLGAGS
jgi:NitT/TauT family transport system substrate-binding protein